jgi:hypothetical protein
MNELSFRDATIVFATNHGKCVAANGPFGTILNSKIEELRIDSDRMGTFSGEIERPGSMLDALRGKVELAREITSSRFVLVSEGSFGSTDGLGLITRGIELLMLHDAARNIEVIEQLITFDTNYATAVLSTDEDLARFLPRIPLGAHGLILYPDGCPHPPEVHKGITTPEEAVRAFASSRDASPVGRVLATTDMRAHMNPTRMRAIGACCELLAYRLATPCPHCGSGGFGLVESIPGLPCEWCGSPTLRARAERHACVICKKHLDKPRRDGKAHADPSECPACNP